MRAEVEAIVAENERRKALKARWDYSQETGDPFDPARRRECGLWLPVRMLADPRYSPSLRPREMAMLRFRHDFEYWAWRCVRIMDKVTMTEIPFVLNAPQRRLVKELERMRTAGEPLRLIMLKARQWGGSTLIQVYFAWIQIVHRRGWNSLICAHVKDTSATIRGIYSRLLARYPEEFWEEECKPEFRPFERMSNTRFIPGRECRVTVSSSENQESTRGQDYALAHLSEVAFWKDTAQHNPVDLIRSVTSGIMRKPLSFVALESTANGVGNFFHREWMRACSDGGSDKLPFFVPWFEIGIYAEPVGDPEALWDSLDTYERRLWEAHEGVTLEGLRWYRMRRREYEDLRSMMTEFPSTPEEAFATTSRGVFSAEGVARLRRGVCPPAMTGEPYGCRGSVPSDLSAPGFAEDAGGGCKVWEPPRPGASYVAAVDIGGRSAGADWSVIVVIDRKRDRPGELPEVVAQWRGHIDHDLLAWKAAALAAWYCRALLVVESNTLESDGAGEGPYVLSRLSRAYGNLYRRPSGAEGGAGRTGFHTNRSTKHSIIANLVALVREDGYVERDAGACDELGQYEMQEGGGYGARRGCHDDMLMARAIALWVHAEERRSNPPLSQAEIQALRDLCG